MRKALVALVGTAVVGVLLFPAPAAAKHLAYQGDAAGSPITMTMTGKSFAKPKRVTSFSLTAVGGDCAYTGPNPVTLPIPQSTNGRGIVIKRNPQQGAEFRWSYEAGGISYDVQGRQDLKHARRWFGRLFIYFATPPGQDCASDYALSWNAEFTG